MNGVVVGVVVGLILLFIATGFVAGLVRGLKRASVHTIFLLASILVAFFITKPITSAVLNGITVVSNGASVSLQQLIVNQIYKLVDLSTYSGANAFLSALPTALASPFVFILLAIVVFSIFDIIYLVVARIAFGKKKVDFQEHKPRRWYGAAIGAVEGLIFLLVLFAPITALTKTYEQIAISSTVSQSEKTLQTSALQTRDLQNNALHNDLQNNTQENDNFQYNALQSTVKALGEDDVENGPKLKTIPQMFQEVLPKEFGDKINEIVTSYNKSILAKVLGSGANGGGIDKMFFDGLANVKISGTKINLRKELLGISDVYNEVVVVYNAFDAKEFDNLDIKGLTNQIQGFVNRGFFKAVLADTAKQYLQQNNFENSNIPQVLKEVLDALKEKLNTEENSFDFYQFLKDDIFKLTQAMEKLFEKTTIPAEDSQLGTVSKSLISDIMDLFGKKDADSQEVSLKGLLQVLDNHKEVVQIVAKDVINLQTMKIAFEPVLNFASEKVQEYFKDEQGIVDESIKLNPNIEDWDAFVENTLNAMTDFSKVIDDVTTVLKGDKNAFLAEISNMDLPLLGSALDGLRNLEILKFKKQDSPQTEYEYVLDNILKTFGLQLLGDEVEMWLPKEDAEAESLANQQASETENDDKEFKQVTLSSYSLFFEYISQSMEGIKKLGIADVLSQENVDAETLIDTIVSAMKNNQTNETTQSNQAKQTNQSSQANQANQASESNQGAQQTKNTTSAQTTLLADALMPFYKLQKAHITEQQSIKELIFGLITDNLKGVEILDFSALQNDEENLQNDTYENWKSELENLGKALCALSDGTIEVEEDGAIKTYTYLKYFLNVSQPDFEKLLNTILKKTTAEDDAQESEFCKVLRPIFDGKLFKPVVNKIYETLTQKVQEIDQKIENITQINPQTDFTTWAEASQDVVADLEAALRGVLDLDFDYSGSASDNQAFEFVGKILDAIKTSAFNNGEKNGLLNGEFVNLVWYLTGDNLTGGADQRYAQPPTTSEDVTGNYLKNLREKIKEKCLAQQNLLQENLDKYYEVDFQLAIQQAIQDLTEMNLPSVA